MTEESTQIAGERLASFYTQFAQMADEREKQLGHPAENSPTAADLWRLVRSFQDFSAISGSVPVSEADRLMRALVEVSDKWVDPESDPIGMQIHGPIEALIDDLQQLIGKTLPEAAESLQQWNSLRRLEQATRRALYLRKKLKPKLLSYLYGKWQDILIAHAFRK